MKFLAGGGEMGARMRALDWSRTSLGSPENWPQSLKTIVRVMLDSRYAMWMLWGPELTFFCNDAYLPTVGIKRDWVLGARSNKVWEEIWSDIWPRIRKVLEQGQATWDEGLLLFLERSGFREETYHTFSYSPVYDDDIHIAGMLCVVTEVTERVISERRLRVLRDLAARAAGEETVREALARLMRVIGDDLLDVPFAALYQLDEKEGRARLAAHFGPLPEALRPPELPVAADLPWPIGAVDEKEEARLVDIPAQFVIPAPFWPEDSVARAIVLPVLGHGSARCAAILVAGVSTRRALDDGYRGFFDLVAGHFTAAIADAQAYEDERRRAEALAEIDRAKTQFFSNVSHEFRTPLTLMLGPVAEAANDPQVPDALRSQLQLAHRNSLRLLKLVNSLLDFSRIEAGRVQSSFEPVDLGALTSDLASAFRAAIEGAELEFRVECEAVGQTFVDREMWEKIVLNLLSNAFKFTFRGGISVRLRAAAREAVLEVADTGVGIAAAELPRIFERFHRIEGSAGRTQEGSGIGLALVQELVKLHGGAVEVDSELEQGTTFRVRLPLGCAHLPAERIRTGPAPSSTGLKAEAYVQEALRWLPRRAPETFLPLAVPMEVAASTAAADPRQPLARILLADDNADMRVYLGELLCRDYTVETVADGEAALAALQREPADLVISDVMMPRLDGFGLLKAVRADTVMHAMPFILLSARAGEAARAEGLEARADDYLIKPFFARELLSRVDALLTLSRMRRAGEERLRAYMDSLTDGFYVLDSAMRFSFVNSTITARMGKTREQLLGRRVWDVIPEAVGTESHVHLSRALHKRAPVEYEVYFPPWLAWFRNKVYPTPDGGIAVYSKDITEERRAEKLIEQQNADLREADQQKDEFLAMLAHELRNPLASIGNAGEILTRITQGGSGTELPLALLKRQTRQLTRLVDDLLDISRIARGRITLDERSLELGAVIDQAIESVQPLIQEKSHRLITVKHHIPLYVRGDLARLVQSFSNLLHNAAKYTDPGGEIRVAMFDVDDEVLVEVCDNGVGISADLLPHVFDLFVQSERKLDRSQGGVGIGLSVVKRLIGMHSGTVTVASSGPGEGATFAVRLPRIAAPEAAQPLPPAAIAARRRILVVDDNIDAADSLAMLLQLDGHEVEAAYGGAAAIEAVQRWQPQMIFLDIGLPEMDGYEVARRLRAQHPPTSLRLIALTGYGQQEDVERSYAAGFNDHLVKPVSAEALEAILAAGSPA
ncbi:MAG TPA: ATP-binding protein [Steroidobacteraceae bacterium]|nr:ATP-binding protein [Steroidobacteraceae bacterium]